MRLLFLLIILIPVKCLSQVDSTYIGFYDLRLGVKAFVARDFVFLAQETKGQEEVTYMPNNPAKIGAGFSVNNSVISFGYGYGFDFLRDKKKGKTKSFDFQYHNYGRKFVFDIYVQQYEGFYTEDGPDGGNLRLYPDMEINQYALYGHYVFNNKKYSYRAAFNQSERQLKSTGSFLLGGGVYYTDIKSDSSFLYNDKHTYSRIQLGISGGYAYTWALGRYWLLSASATVGVNFGSESFDDLGRKIEIYPSVFPRFSAAYANKSWIISFSYVNNILFNPTSKDDNIAVSSGSFQLGYSKRFNLPNKKIFKIFDLF